jgi:hypothetical protein
MQQVIDVHIEQSRGEKTALSQPRGGASHVFPALIGHTVLDRCDPGEERSRNEQVLSFISCDVPEQLTVDCVVRVAEVDEQDAVVAMI